MKTIIVLLMLSIPGVVLAYDCPKTKAEYKAEIKARAKAAEIIKLEELANYARNQAQDLSRELVAIDPVKMPSYHKEVYEEYRYWSDLWESRWIELQKLEMEW